MAPTVPAAPLARHDDSSPGPAGLTADRPRRAVIQLYDPEADALGHKESVHARVPVLPARRAVHMHYTMRSQTCAGSARIFATPSCRTPRGWSARASAPTGSASLPATVRPRHPQRIECRDPGPARRWHTDHTVGNARHVLAAVSRTPLREPGLENVLRVAATGRARPGTLRQPPRPQQPRRAGRQRTAPLYQRADASHQTASRRGGQPVKTGPPFECTGLVLLTHDSAAALITGGGSPGWPRRNGCPASSTPASTRRSRRVAPARGAPDRADIGTVAYNSPAPYLAGLGRTPVTCCSPQHVGGTAPRGQPRVIHHRYSSG